MAVQTVHTCPRCELKFEFAHEVADHLVRDHGVDPKTLEAGPPEGLLRREQRPI